MRKKLIILFNVIMVIFINITDGIGQIPTTDKNWNTTPVLNQSFFSNSLPDPTIWNYDVYGANTLLHCGANPICELQLYRYQNLFPSSDTTKGLTMKELNNPMSGKIFGYSPPDSTVCDGGKNYRNFNYISGSITTKIPYSYGYYQADIWVPKGKGLWPAFWLHAYGQEIDILEIPGAYSEETLKYQANVYGLTPSPEDSKDINTGDLSTGFHNFAIEWTPERVVFYFDKKPVRSVSGTGGSHVPNIPMKVMFNLAVSPWVIPLPPNLTNNDLKIKNFKIYQLKTAFITPAPTIDNFNTYDYKVYLNYNIANKALLSGYNVTLRAATYIRIDSSFEVPEDAEFNAIITKSW